MKSWLLLGSLLVTAALASVQKTAEVDKEAHRRIAQIASLQHKIDQMEAKVRDYEEQIAQIRKQSPVFLPKPVLPEPKVAQIVWMSATIFVNSGKPNLRVGDTLLIVRRRAKGGTIQAKVRVEAVYDKEAAGGVIANYGGVAPEDEAYVINRTNSIHSIQWLSLEPPMKSDQEFVLVGSVRDSAWKSARAALDRAGIAYSSGGDRGLTGIRVSKSDFARARQVLKANALSHHYAVFLAD